MQRGVGRVWRARKVREGSLEGVRGDGELVDFTQRGVRKGRVLQTKKTLESAKLRDHFLRQNKNNKQKKNSTFIFPGHLITNFPS